MRRERKKLSAARRWSRILVWTAFAVVLCLRFAFPPEPPRRFGPGGPMGFEPQRRYRRSTPVSPPVSEVPASLWRLQIQMAPKEVEILRSYSWNGQWGGSQDRPEVLATIREGGLEYTNVAIHLKGAAGSFRPFDDKPALTLNFSKHAPGQRFHGYTKFSLNNSVQDPSYLEEAISRELFEAAGVPVPRADHATVLINGRDLGLYVLVEGYGKQFLKRHFRNVSGKLYDGGFCQDLHPNMDTNSGDLPKDDSGLKRLIAAASIDGTNRWERLNQVLDMDRFISFLAMEIMTCHGDGYAMNRNNYRIFHNLETDRLIFMPHGMDQMFGRFRFNTDGEIEPSMRGFVARAALTTPQGRRTYLDRMAHLRTNVFLETKLTNRVHEIASRIRPTLAAYNPALATQHDYQVARLCDRIIARARSIAEQLASLPEPIQFDERGAARLSGWQPGRTPPQPGGPRLEKIDAQGKTWLHITAAKTGGTGAWRTSALLEAGRYRFEGRVRTNGPENSGTVGLRTSRGSTRWQITGGSEWREISSKLTVEEPIEELEFICELRAPQGEAWFDEESFRLIRE